jgi:nucleotide-binding universal stress UspA family protein
MDVPTDAPPVPQPRDASAEHRPRVVVGVDGSPGSRAALVRALAEAARRGADLDVVTSTPMPLPWTGIAPVVVPGHNEVLTELAGRARALLTEAQEEPAVHEVPGATAVHARVLAVESAAAQALVDSAAGADLLVVGSRGRGAMRSALLGSVALHCVTHAPCPVLVVHGNGTERPDAPVVVGVDGSEESLQACRAAIEEAARRGTDVEVVSVYAPEDFWTDLYSIDIPSAAQIRHLVRVRVEELTAAAREEAVVPADARAPEVTVEVIDGAADDVLVHRSGAAGLLVLSNRGHGSLRGLLLGSVALHVVMHADCPVLVVRPTTAAHTSSEQAAALVHG